MFRRAVEPWRSLSIARLVVGLGVWLGGFASAQAPGDVTVVTFNRELINWATAVERDFDLPDIAVPFSKVTLTLQLDCPGGGCDPWDRGASLYVHGHNGAGRPEPFELVRFITPYGRGCSWEADVTDYRLFLAGRTRLGCYIETYIGGNQGWLVTVRLTFHAGPPAREVLSIDNLWRGKPVYGDPGSPIESFFAERTLTIDPAASAAKLRFFVTGHGQGNTGNAAEFARKLHGLQVNADHFEHDLWRDDCDQNPCSPQGGTWQYDRAGWCPGDVADPWDVDISASVAPGEEATLRYEVEPYTNRCRPTAGCVSGDCIWGSCDYDGGSHTPPVYWVESQLITYRSVLGSGSGYTFQPGAGGATGVVDTVLSEADPNADRSAATPLVVDGDDPPGSRKQKQALLRFEGIFGDGAGQIPPGTPIQRASLRLATTNTGSGASLHRMLAPWDAAAGWASHGGNGIQAGVEALAAADAVVDARAGGLVEADVTASLEAWSADPCAHHGWALLPVGDDGWEFASAEGIEPPSLVVESRRIVDDVLIAVGDEWSYFKGTRAPPSNWKLPGFVPGAGWLVGPTGIGYADDDDATVLGDMQGSYASVFCRRELEVGAPPAALRLKIDYDDGFAAYLNGVEVARSATMGAPGVPIAWNALAPGSREAGQPEVFDLPVSALVPGTNVLAIEVHNTTLDSSDLSLLPALIADHALLPPGSPWRFLRGSRALPASWKELSFNDAAWETGRTSIGYGDEDDLTQLLDMQNSYGAIFCRHDFAIDNPGALEALSLRVLYDDGVVVFVNGTEVQRLNMPAGAVTRTLLARSAIEPQAATIPIPTSLLVAGRNVVAVSVHNASLDSSDLSFDAALVASVGPATSSCEPTFRRGDADGDGQLNITDAVLTLGFLFLGTRTPSCLDAADADDDGHVMLTDAVYLLSYLFNAGPPLPPPASPSCGIDPTADALDCQQPVECP